MAREICPSCGSRTALGDSKCFKCGYFNKRYTTKEYNPSSLVSNMDLPDEIIFNPNQMGLSAIEWLAKAHIYKDTILKYKIGYCPTIDKVFLPAFDKGDNLRFFQLRSLKKDDPRKYMTYGKSAEYLINYTDFDTNSICIVEDHLSAIRLRKFTNVIALSGTSLRKENIKALLSNFNDFIFWLDSDSKCEPGKRPGRQALYKNMSNIARQADLKACEDWFYNRSFVEIKFKSIDYNTIVEDPKFYSDSEIYTILKSNVRSIECSK